jgi:hypothetical protein
VSKLLHLFDAFVSGFGRFEGNEIHGRRSPTDAYVGTIRVTVGVND